MSTSTIRVVAESGGADNSPWHSISEVADGQARPGRKANVDAGHPEAVATNVALGTTPACCHRSAL